MTSEWIPGIQVNGACEAEGVGGEGGVVGGGGGGWMVVQHSSNPAMCSAWEGRWPHGLCAWHQCLSFCATDASSIIMPLLHLNGFWRLSYNLCNSRVAHLTYRADGPQCAFVLFHPDKALFSAPLAPLRKCTSTRLHNCYVVQIIVRCLINHTICDPQHLILLL